MGDKGKDYIKDMQIAQKYAELNRHYILTDLLEYFGLSLKGLERIISIHNYISPVDNIIRKGAISAYKDQRLVIPLNMRDGIIVGTGKSNKDWNFSAPHGAGRIMSRSQAKKKISLEDYKESMGGIWSSCVNRSTLDEAPMAYKDTEVIKESIQDTVDIEFVMHPVYNFKAEDER